jgi:hypothetical protein
MYRPPWRDPIRSRGADPDLGQTISDRSREGGPDLAGARVGTSVGDLIHSMPPHSQVSPWSVRTPRLFRRRAPYAAGPRRCFPCKAGPLLFVQAAISTQGGSPVASQVSRSREGSRKVAVWRSRSDCRQRVGPHELEAVNKTSARCPWAGRRRSATSRRQGQGCSGWPARDPTARGCHRRCPRP